MAATRMPWLGLAAMMGITLMARSACAEDHAFNFNDEVKKGEERPGFTGSVRFRANRVKIVFSSIHSPPFLLITRGGDGFTSHPKKPVWREI